MNISETVKSAVWVQPYLESVVRFVGNDHVDECLERWREPHRKFHTLLHLQSVIECFPTEDPGFALAALYHDAVYEPGLPDNETKSAELLRKHSQEFFPGVTDSEARVNFDTVIAKANRIILSTAVFRHKEDPDEEAFFCADCQVLLGDWEALLVYEERIRAEFQNVHEALYMSGRCSFLENASEVFPENAELLLRLRDHVKAGENK